MRVTPGVTGSAPAPTLSTTNLTFGDQTVGMTSEAQPVTLKNRGNAALTIGYISVGGDFGQTNNCGGGLPAGATCTINVTFTPADTGTRTGQLTIADDALGSPRKIDLSGTGVPPHVSVTPPSLDFGNQLVGTPSAPQTVTLTNNGTETLNISNIATSGDFAQTNTCGTSVAAGNSCTFDVRFSPTEAGPRTGTLAITDDAEGSPHTVSLSGTGAQPAVSLEPPNLSFGNVRVGTTSAPQAVTLTNTGTAPLTISSITTSAGFGQTSDCPIAPSTLGAGGSCTINITFAPTETRPYEGQLTVTDNASGSPHTVGLYGTGVGPGVSLLPTTLVFANQNVGTTSPPQTVTLTNSGAWPLQIYNIAVTVGFAQTHDCPLAPSPLDVSASCTINVRFAPTEAVYYSGKLTVTDNAPGSPHSVPLVGTGLGPVVLLRPPNQSFGEQVVWTNSAPKVLTLTNIGTSTLTVSGFMMIGASYADFAQSNNCVGQLPIGVKCSVHVVFTPRLEASRTAYLVIIDDAADSPQIAAFTGTGTPNPNTPPPQAYTLVRADYATGAYPVALARGDFNRDGLLDVVVADRAGAAISLLLGATNGTLQSHMEYSTGALPVAVVSGDFNGDGKLDVAVASKQDNNVAILLGKGDGTFQAAAAYATGLSPSGVVAGDFNSDSKLDLAVTNSADNTVSILLGNGDGTFQGQTTLATGTNPTSVTAADLNADNKLDLVVTNAGNNTVSVLLGNGDGTFQTPGVFATGAYPVSATVGDFNRDGSPDLAVANLNGDTVSILLGNGNGTFGTQTAYPTGDYPTAVIAEDFNGDNKLDLAVADSNCDAAGTCSATGFVSVLLGNGNGTFQPHVQYASGSGPQALLVADFNRDGKLDLAVANAGENTVSVFIGQGNGTFGTRNDQSTGGTSPSSVVTADFNGDSNTDVAVVNQGSNTVTVSLGNGDGTFQSPQSFATGRSPAIIAVADFNGDNKLDLAVTNSVDNTVSILLGNGDGTFQPQTTVPTGTGPQGIMAVDFNGDGKVDLAVANFVDNTVWVLLGNGNGTFQAPITLATGANPISLAAADFNLDGKLDLAVANQGANTVSVLLGIGDGTFTSGVQYPTGATPSLVAAADFNMDGKPDLAVVNAGDNTLSILKGNGDGTFGARANYATGNNPASVTVGDFNGDGIPDVAVANKGGSGGAGGLSAKASRGGAGSKLDVPQQAPITGTISVLLGTISGVLQSRLDYSTGPNPTAAATGTFTQGGSSGLAVANADGTVSVLVNTPVAALSHSALEFGNQVAGTTSVPVAITLSNPGSAPLALVDIEISGPFTKTDTCFAPTKLPVGGQCTINVRFAPTAQGSAAGSLTLFSRLQTSPQIVALSGTGAPPGPLVLLSPSSLIFSDQVVGQSSAPQMVTLTNNGTATLNISGISIIGPNSGDFGQANNCAATLAASLSCTIDITFTPTATGSRTATLSISSDAPGSPHTVPLSGTGIQAGLSLSPPSLSFGNQLVGTTSDLQTVTLTNNGTATLNIASIAITGTNGGDFAQANTCGSSLAAAANCAVNVTFTPTAVGTRSGTVAINDDATGSPQTVSLSGTGVAPATSLTPTSLSFGNQLVGSTSATQPVTLTNNGTATLNISGIAITGTNAGDFAQANTCGATLATSGSCTINVTFKPTATGAKGASIAITSDAATSPDTIALSGTGTDFSIAVGSGSSTTATVNAGQTASYILSLAPSGFSGTVTMNCAWSTSQPRGTKCTISPASVNLDGTNAAQVTVSVSTTARSGAGPQPESWRATRGRPPIVPFAIWLMGLITLMPLAAFRRRRTCVGFAVSVLLVVLWVSCGGGGGGGGSPPPPQTGTPAGTYTLSVTATALGVSKSPITLTLKVN
ncbi:MAG: choice-of-anchor D domain-containing protein [Terriglobia bacterium]